LTGLRQGNAKLAACAGLLQQNRRIRPVEQQALDPAGVMGLPAGQFSRLPSETGRFRTNVSFVGVTRGDRALP
jgi:hypothetical protein